MKVVQRTVLYAPGGRSLRDVNAKTKVTARATIYSIPAGKIERVAIPPIISAVVSKSMFTSQKVKDVIKKV